VREDRKGPRGEEEEEAFFFLLLLLLLLLLLVLLVLLLPLLRLSLLLLLRAGAGEGASASFFVAATSVSIVFPLAAESLTAALRFGGLSFSSKGEGVRKGGKMKKNSSLSLSSLSSPFSLSLSLT
jgi:hypothetical protein